MDMTTTSSHNGGGKVRAEAKDSGPTAHHDLWAAAGEHLAFAMERYQALWQVISATFFFGKFFFSSLSF